jgi:hypothetical protein
MIKGYQNGVTIFLSDSSLTYVLCSNCAAPLIEQLSGLNNIVDCMAHRVIEANQFQICDACSQVIYANRRSGVERRTYEYDIHIPDKRAKFRRKEDVRAIL